MKSQILLFSVLFYSLSAMDKQENNAINYLQYMPVEVQELIASHIEEYPGYEDDAEFFKKDMPRTAEQPFENKTVKIYINEFGNLKCYDKKKKKSDYLLKVADEKLIFLTMIKTGYNALFNKKELPEKAITKFAVSPDRTQLIALEGECFLGKEEKQNGLWIIDLKTTDKKFITIPDLFSQVYIQVPGDAKEYTELGYKTIGFNVVGRDMYGIKTISHMKKLFESLAISNNRMIAIADLKNVYCIHPDTNEYELKYTNEQLPDLIHSMEFNKQSSKVRVVDAVQTSKCGLRFYKNLIPVMQESRKTLVDYCYRRCICKPAQLQ